MRFGRINISSNLIPITMKTEKRKVGKWPATIYHPCDDTGWRYTISYDDGNDGAVISDVNLEKAEKKFIEAMTLGNAVYKLMYFSEFGIFLVQNN